MNPSSALPTDGPILGLVGEPNPTPLLQTTARPTTLEARMETLQQDMARMQEHNNVLASKLDDTQRQLHQQQTLSAQLQNDREPTTQLRQEKSFKSVRKPTFQDRGKQQAANGPTVSRRLFVPTPKERHPEYRVYSDCRERINDRRRERQSSPIQVRAKLDDPRLEVLGPKSPLRQRYGAIGLEETDESDYVPTSPGTTISSAGPSARRHSHRSNQDNDRRKGNYERSPSRTADQGRRGHNADNAQGTERSSPLVTIFHLPIRLFVSSYRR